MTDTFELPTPEVNYFMRRIAEARRVSGIPASVAFDLARSPISDDQLEDATVAFGAQKKSGWGLSELMQDMLARDPNAVPVNDIRTLQENLVKKGYTDSEPTGVWDPSWYGAFRRMDRDAQETIRSGHNWEGGTIVAGINFITNTLPSRVWQGIIGTAKGLVLQTPETVGRVGALGGAAAGAAIGASATAAFGPGAAIGAGVGAIVGGITGFLGDLFGKDEGEEGQGTFTKILDALQPFNEYADNPKAFWEDLGYVGSAASLIGGAGMVAKGAQAGMAGIRGVQAAATSPMVGAPMEMASTSGVPTFWQAAIAKQGAAQEIGAVPRLLLAATKRPFPETTAWLRERIAVHGLIAQQTRPAVQLVNKVYTGLVAGQLGSRFAAGFTGPRFDQWQGQTTIEKSLAETAPLHTIDTPIGDLVDLGAFLIMPERYFPWPKGAAAKAAQKLALGDANASRLFPFAMVEQEASGMAIGYGEAYQRVVSKLTPAKEMRIRADYGVKFEAEQRALSDPFLRQDPERFGYAKVAAQHDVIREIREGLESDNLDPLKRLVQHSFDKEGDFTKWLGELQGQGRGLDFVNSEYEAQRIALRAEQLVDKGSFVDVNHTIMQVSDVPEGVSPVSLQMRPRETDAFARAVTRSKIKVVEDEAKRLRGLANRGMDPNANIELLSRVRELEDQARILKGQLGAARAGGAVLRDADTMRIVPARVETLTRKNYYALHDEFLRLRQKVSAAWKAEPESQAYTEAQAKLNTFVDDLVDRGEILPKVAKKAKRPTPDKKIADYLERRGDHAARDIELEPELKGQMEALGYKPVLTGEDVLFTEDVEKLAETYSVSEYSRRAALVETLGFSPRWRDNVDAFQFRVYGEQAEVGQALADVPIKPGKAIELLHRKVEDLNHAGATAGPLVVQGAGKWRLFKTDLRDLSLDDLMDVKGLSNLPGYTDETAKNLFGAIRRGAALGGEVNFLRPMESMRVMGRAMRVNGLPGFSDAIRTWHVKDPAGWGFVKKGAVLGAGEAVYEDMKQHKPLSEIVKDSVEGAVMGAAAGGLLRGLAKKNYGYLPDILVRANTALRFSLSLTFDAGRYMEQGSIAYEKYGLPFMLSPRKYIARYARENGLKIPGGGVITNGDDAFKFTSAFWDEVNGTSYFRVIDDIDRRMYQRGLLAFSPRDWEAAQAMLLYQRGMKMSEIRDAVSHIGRYGPGRTAAEKSMNFIFFPFSFSKKLFATLGDFMIQAPARALMLHEGWRRYAESTLRDDVNLFLQDHLPIMQSLWQINNLSYGLAPGRFFLEGMADQRTNAGKVMQALTSVFAPSGAATPLAQAAGALGDLSVQAFSPIVVTGESITRAGGANGLADVVMKYIPFVRELNTYFLGKQAAFKEQWKANPTWLGGQGLAPYSQYQDYIDGLREYKDELEPLALAMGYSSVDGLLGSKMGLPFKMQYDKQRLELMKKYPTGAAMSQEFENSALMNERAIKDLAEKVNPSEGEQAIIRLSEEQWKWRMLGQVTSLPSEIVNGIAAQRIRSFALKYVNDRRFRELYELLYESQYGPIAMTEV